MDKMVSFIFKFLGVSLIMMFLFNTSLMLIDTITVHSRITSLANVMINEIARNNSIPDDLSDMFQEQYDNILANSQMVVVEESGVNIKQDLTIKDKEYKMLTEENALNYGDVQKLGFVIKMDASKVYLKNGKNIGYVLEYTYDVPCLRYLK